jgi:hypothetical protein
MSLLQPRALALALALAYPLISAQADPAQTTATDSLPTVQVQSARNKLDAARNGLARYRQHDLQVQPRRHRRLPLGDNTPMNQLLLQAPGVVRTPTAASMCAATTATCSTASRRRDPRGDQRLRPGAGNQHADSVSLLTGALPPQYGYRTAGVVDIQTRDGSADDKPLAGVGVTLGSHQQREADLSLHGSQGALSCSRLHEGNALGIENPTGSRNALHDQTHQGKGFGTLSYLLDPDSRVTAMFGVTNNRFQIPDVPGQTPAFDLAAPPPRTRRRWMPTSASATASRC